MTPQVKSLAEERLVAALKDGPKTFSELGKVAKACFGAGDCCETPPLVYQILWEMNDQLHLDSRRVEGAFDHLDAPKIYISLKSEI